MKRFFAVLALSLSLIGCVTSKRQPAPSPKEFAVVSHAGQIVDRVYKETRCEEFRFLDPFLVRPTRIQFAEMVKFCALNRTPGYQINLFDCEDHVREFRVFASRYALKTYAGLPAAIAVGQAIVRIAGQVDGLGDYSDNDGLHAMVVVVLADGRTILLEPRNSRYIFPLAAVYEGCVEFVSIEF